MSRRKPLRCPKCKTPLVYERLSYYVAAYSLDQQGYLYNRRRSDGWVAPDAVEIIRCPKCDAHFSSKHDGTLILSEIPGPDGQPLPAEEDAQ